ncbi:MAG: VWA domain-containing protein [Brevinematales bacterium]|nr:VWA domain-containing protein [Brevinematales bacterium]
MFAACGTATKGGNTVNAPQAQTVVTGKPVMMAEYAKKSKDKSAPTMDSKIMVNDVVMGGDEETPGVVHNTEDYDHIQENEFLDALKVPLSTFSIDVDTAAYANVRRFLMSGQMPYADAVRIEELINYFSYDYPEPTGDDPFSFTTELTECPWNPAHKLLLIGLQAKKVSFEKLPPNNLTFLLDVSGSMSDPNKLPLLISAMKLLVNTLRPEDKIAIVVYAGAAGVILEPTSCSEKEKIVKAMEKLQAGGSTAGGAGIQLAYKLAKENFNKQGNNRVILCTDGDFNVGPSSDGELVKMIEEKRKEGIYLTVLGFGMGNYKDSKMEQLADKGNGNYAYIDNLMEAKKVLVTQMGGTLLTIAKDVKIQIEFNPALVKEYRLIGYENRIMAAKDFDDDTKDAGELGSGHTVTVLYEIVLSDGKASSADLKYQNVTVKEDAKGSKEIGQIKFRYKKPNSDTSKLIVSPMYDKSIMWKDASQNLKWASAVAEWGMLLRDSKFKGEATYAHVLETAKAAIGKDEFGYRKEFIQLVELSKGLSGKK